MFECKLNTILLNLQVCIDHYDAKIGVNNVEMRNGKISLARNNTNIEDEKYYNKILVTFYP